MNQKRSIETKRKILSAAESCFSEKGFDGTGIEEISRRSETNKALIYYHFENKEGLLFALYKEVMSEAQVLVGKSLSSSDSGKREDVVNSIRVIIRFLVGKRDLLKILLMESIKEGKSEDVFMDLARVLMEKELEEMKEHDDFKENVDRFMVYEFFTGFMPLYNYAVFGARWSAHFDKDPQVTEDLFIESFIRSHLSHHHFV